MTRTRVRLLDGRLVRASQADADLLLVQQVATAAALSFDEAWVDAIALLTGSDPVPVVDLEPSVPTATT